MRKIREVLRLRFDRKFSHKKIALVVDIGETTAREYLVRVGRAGLTWPLPKEMDDQALEEKLYPPQEKSAKDMMEYQFIHKELKRKGVTLYLLWVEYAQSQSNPYCYSRFCDLYRSWAKKSDLWMPQEHKGGEKVFIDYAGHTVLVQDNDPFEAQIFVGTLGASNYTYVEASASQSLEDWIRSNMRMLAFFQGAPEAMVPDNVKSGVKRAHRYEASINPTYYEMAKHYGCVVMPARARKPKDKAKVEKAVQDVERQILAPLRNTPFFTLAELNEAIGKLLKKFNQRPFQKRSGSRYSLYQELDKPYLRPLPDAPYPFAYWESKRVGQNYHVTVQKHHYSVPHRWVKRMVEVRYNQQIVEIFAQSQSIAVHQRSRREWEHTTNPNHRPEAHQQHAECTPENLQERANSIGEHVGAWVRIVLADCSLHPFQRERQCLGVLRMDEGLEEGRLEMACQRACHFRLFTYKSIKSILENNLDRQPLTEEKIQSLPQGHENIRGPDYYNENKGEEDVPTSRD